MEWGIVAALLVAALIALVFLPLRVRFSLQGRGEPRGTWAVAGGAQLGPAAASGVAAATLPLSLSLHVFGRKVWQKTARELRDARRKKQAEAADAEDAELLIRERAALAIERGSERYRRLERWFDPLDLALFLVRERRRIRLELVEVDL